MDFLPGMQEAAQKVQQQKPQAQAQQAPIMSGVAGLPEGFEGSVLPTAGGNWARAANDPAFLAQQAAQQAAQRGRNNYGLDDNTAALLQDLSNAGFFDNGSNKFVYYSDIEMPQNGNTYAPAIAQKLMQINGLTYKPNGDYTNEDKQKWYQSSDYSNFRLKH